MHALVQFEVLVRLNVVFFGTEDFNESQDGFVCEHQKTGWIWICFESLKAGAVASAFHTSLGEMNSLTIK